MSSRANMGRTAGLGRGKTWNPIRASNDPMGEPSRIGWHCEKVSPACEHCYAERQNLVGARGGTRLPYKPGHRANGDTRVYLDEQTLLAPLSWRQPTGVFVCSMTDAFGDWVRDEWLDKMFAVAALCPQHIFIFLTKRPTRMREYIGKRSKSLTADAITEAAGSIAWAFKRGLQGCAGLAERPLPNVWLGVTAEDQQRADERREDLRALAAHGWTTLVSYGPALGPVDWTGWEFVSQIIFEGESGPQARPSHPRWARDTRDFCAPRGIAFFLKQWGEWKPISEMPESEYAQFYRSNKLAGPGEDQGALDELYGRRCTIPTDAIGYAGARGHDGYTVVDGKGGMMMFRVGRTRAGRTLDGREHDEFPARRA